MFCGTGNFAHMDDHDDPSAPPSTPKASKKKPTNKNPYATRGLDKFSMVLAELESRREKIIERAGSQGVALIRFVYDSSQDWVPIVVRPKEAKVVHGEEEEEEKKKKKKKKEERQVDVEAKPKNVEEKKKKKKRGVLWGSWCYWGLVMVLILLCMVMFGRVFAICCTSIWWYVMPRIKGLGGDFNERRGMNLMKRKLEINERRLGGNLRVQIKKNGGGKKGDDDLKI